jgi:hypothetical protein
MKVHKWIIFWLHDISKGLSFETGIMVICQLWTDDVNVIFQV